MKSKIDCIIPVSHSCNIIAYVKKLGVKYFSGIVNNHCCLTFLLILWIRYFWNLRRKTYKSFSKYFVFGITVRNKISLAFIDNDFFCSSMTSLRLYTYWVVKISLMEKYFSFVFPFYWDNSSTMSKYWVLSI